MIVLPHQPLLRQLTEHESLILSNFGEKKFRYVRGRSIFNALGEIYRYILQLTRSFLGKK